jgi:hypothetical protein
MRARRWESAKGTSSALEMSSLRVYCPEVFERNMEQNWPSMAKSCKTLVAAIKVESGFESPYSLKIYERMGAN